MRIRKSARLILLTIVSSAIVASCNVATPPGELNAGAISADVSGTTTVTFVANNAKAQDHGTTIAVHATDDAGDEIGFSVEKQAALPYTITESSPVSNLQYLEMFSGGSSATFIANQTHGAFTITVRQLSPTFRGEFSGSLRDPGSADSVRSVQSGVFNAVY